ncbi:MAG: histidine--tRNA ligase [Deltaproteobacteria bacterium]|nr:MAG: histidine--tRNA ligase [Deltaproteobacteria bacterium]
MSQHALRGMNDIRPPDISIWHEVEKCAHEIFPRYLYQEIRTPILEDMSVFTRSIGDTTNIVEKEMYVFQDRGGKWVALRPEGTAPVVRAYIEHHGNPDEVVRYYYMGAMYRYERPQQGRFREFHQLGAEVLGISSPKLDAEVIHMVDVFFKHLGIKNAVLEINSLGCPICRPKFLRAFFDFLHKNEDKLCSDCKRRMEKNPLRALDCKNPGCDALTREGPSIHDFLCEDCEKDFDTVLETLGLLKTEYKVNPKIVRGLDYYIKTTFEFTSNALGSQNAIAGGGRYDGLVRLMGGPNVPAVGFAIGLERLVDIIKAERNLTAPVLNRKGLFFATLGEKALQKALVLAQQLRNANIPVGLDYEGKSLKSQMRKADKMGAEFVMVIGDSELEKNEAQLRNMSSSTETTISLDQILQALQSIPA